METLRELEPSELSAISGGNQVLKNPVGNGYYDIQCETGGITFNGVPPNQNAYTAEGNTANYTCTNSNTGFRDYYWGNQEWGAGSSF